MTTEAPRVLCVGRLVPAKGQLILIRAVARLRDEGLNWRLDLVGEGPSRPALEDEVARSELDGEVRLLGARPQSDVRERHRRADAFCLPSFAEGLPVVLMEAMASGVPVLTTRVAAIPELVQDGRTGLLVAPGSVEQLAAGLRRLHADPGLRARLGRAGRARVAADYDLAVNVARLRELFVARLGP